MREKLSRQEEQAMQAVWKVGEGNVKTFLENMSGDAAPPYTTLASTIKNLEKKGYLSSRQVGNMYLYKPVIDEKEYKKNSLTTLVKQHFDNSYKDMVAFFAEQKKISAKELKEIIDMIDNKKTRS
jgi:BlaI family transcriptional regulator, penicillinase repressor